MTAREVLRLSLYTSGRCLDVVVDAATTPQALVEHVASDRHGAAVTCSGQRLHEHVALVGQGVQDGDVLHLGGTGPVSPDPVSRTAPLADRPPVRPGALAGAALALAGALCVATALPGVRPVAAVAAGTALTVVVAAAAAPRTRVGAALRVFAPSAAGAGVAALLPRTDPSALAVTAGAVAAAVTAAVLLVDRQRPAPALPVQLVLAAVLAGVSGGAMLLGAPGAAAAALLIAATVCLVRLLPGYALQVPDPALLEAGAVASTAWSVPRPPPARASVQVRAPDVADRVHAARGLLDAGVAGAVLLALGCLPVVLQPGRGALPDSGAAVLAGCCATALPLAARSYRAAVSRAVLVAGGALVGTALLARVAVTAGPSGRWLLVALLAPAGAGAAAAAVLLGRGWRSVRWARVGDLLEGVALALTPAAAFVAADGVEQVRRLVA